MNKFNIEKKRLEGNCSICNKDFSTKFDGKILRGDDGIVCHEHCAVSTTNFSKSVKVNLNKINANGIRFLEMCARGIARNCEIRANALEERLKKSMLTGLKFW